MQQSEINLHVGTTVSSGPDVRPRSSTCMFTAYLSASGGTATCNVYGKASKDAPWKLLGTMILSGASAQDQFTVVNEAWAFVKGDISAISSATATIVMGS